MFWSDVISGILYQSEKKCVSSQEKPKVYSARGILTQAKSWAMMDWN